MAELTTEERVERGMELLSWEYATEEWGPWLAEGKSRRGMRWERFLVFALGAVATIGVGTFLLAVALGPRQQAALLWMMFVAASVAAFVGLLLFFGGRFVFWATTPDATKPPGTVLFTSTGVALGSRTITWDVLTCARVESGVLVLHFKRFVKLMVPIPSRLTNDVEELCDKLNDMIAGRKGERVLKPEPSNKQKSTPP